MVSKAEQAQELARSRKYNGELVQSNRELETAIRKLAHHFGFYENYLVPGVPGLWGSEFDLNALLNDLDALRAADESKRARRRLGLDKKEDNND